MKSKISSCKAAAAEDHRGDQAEEEACPGMDGEPLLPPYRQSVEAVTQPGGEQVAEEALGADETVAAVDEAHQLGQGRKVPGEAVAQVILGQQCPAQQQAGQISAPDRGEPSQVLAQQVTLTGGCS